LAGPPDYNPKNLLVGGIHLCLKTLGVLVAAAALVYAQGTTALLSGTVQDPTGAAVPAFGQITSAYRDTSNAVDPGGRILEFVARINF
jgi:hypothetical protein